MKGSQLKRYFSGFSNHELIAKKLEIEGKIESETFPIAKNLLRDELYWIKDALKTKRA